MVTNEDILQELKKQEKEKSRIAHHRQVVLQAARDGGSAGEKLARYYR